MSATNSSDGGDVSVVVATAHLPNPPMTLGEKRAEMLAAHRLIQAKYDAGVSIFSKALFRDVVRQLGDAQDDHPRQKKISVTGLDGLAIQFPVETGNVFPWYPSGSDRICVVTKPRLLYHTLGDLLASQDPRHYSVCRAYLPVELAHSTEVRNAETNELLSPWPAADYATVSLRFEQARRRSREAGGQFARLQSALEPVAVPPSIDKIVALGCSTITWADHDDAVGPMAQHILALTLRDLFLARGSAEEGVRQGDDGGRALGITCYAQDPIYTPVDERVLCEAGFKILDDPRAFLEVDESSVVIAVAPDIPVRQIVADIARPALVVWQKFAEADTHSLDPVSPRVKQMLQEYIELPFPGEPEHFGEDLAIYVRKPA